MILYPAKRPGFSFNKSTGVNIHNIQGINLIFQKDEKFIHGGGLGARDPLRGE